MKPNLRYTLAALLIAAMLLSGAMAAYAADGSPDTTGILDTLHGGQPPSMPAQPIAIPAPPTGDFFPLPGIGTKPGEAAPPWQTAPEAPETPETSEMPASATAPAAELYPTDVRGALGDNGARWIVKTYELSGEETPEAIPRRSFTREGWYYEVAEIIKKETANAGMREHTEAVSVNSATQDMTEILKLLAPTLPYADAEGYCGILSLDISSISVAPAGTKTSSYTISATREYPHLSCSDTALVPKTATDKGRTLTLQNVDWQTGNTETIDYHQLPDSYTAVATYTAKANSTAVTGYTTTASYNGTITKMLQGRTAYTVWFLGTEIAPEAAATTESGQKPALPLSLPAAPWAAFAAALAGLFGSLAFFFFFYKNVKVHNLKDGKYLPIGKARVTPHNPVINLTPFADKAATGSFILVLDALATKALSGKALSVNYGDRSLQHIVEGGSGAYQFEIDF